MVLGVICPTVWCKCQRKKESLLQIHKGRMYLWSCAESRVHLEGYVAALYDVTTIYHSDCRFKTTFFPSPRVVVARLLMEICLFYSICWYNNVEKCIYKKSLLLIWSFRIIWFRAHLYFEAATWTWDTWNL